MTARTSVDHASITLGFTTGFEGFGSSFADEDPDFRPGDTTSLTRSRSLGEGTLVYSKPGGSAVTLNYGFGDECIAHGVAIQG